MSIGRAIMVPLQGPTKISPFPSGDLEGCLSWMQEHGFTGAEPVLADPQMTDPRQIKKAFDRAGIHATTIVTGQNNEHLSLSTADEAVRRETVRKMQDYMEFAHEMDAMLTIGLIRGTGADGSKEENEVRLTQSLEVLAKHALDLNVTMLLEPINHTKSSFQISAAEVMEFIDHSCGGMPVKLLWDSFQSDMENEDPLRSLTDSRRLLGHVHFADSDRLFPGDGHIDFDGIYRKLQEIGYEGFVTLECFNKPDGAYILEHAEGLFQRLEQL